jgi:hypothetical protein
VHLSPSVPFKGESLKVTVKEIIGGSIGIEGITWNFPGVLIVWPTVPWVNPARETISPANAVSTST